MEFVQEHKKDDQYSYSDNREEEAQDDQHQDQEDVEDQDEVRNISTHIHLPLSFSASSSRYTSTNTNTNNNSLQFMDYLSLKSGTSTSHSEEGIIICDDNNNNNNNYNRGGVWLCGGGGGGGGGGEREHMFDKVVTPSDVGKLNRLVIPKQHAEKHFPLDSAANEKGLLLNFEDRNGKSWRFRYSYWNSSQSYVMTKGWSRFVKEKKLDAGDIVSFERGVGDSGKGRLYIDWRRRPHQHYQHHHALPNHNSLFPIDHHHQLQQYPSPYPQSSVRWGGGGGSGGSGGGLPYSLPMPPRQQQHENFQYNYDIQYPYLHHQCHHHHPLPPHHHQQHQISGIHDHYSMNYQVKISGNVVSPTTLESIPTGEAAAAMIGRIHHHGKSTTPPVAPSKRLRLFGVNMEYCPKEDQESADHVTMASLLSTTTTPPHHDHHQHHLIPSSSVPYHHQVRLPSNPSPLPITNINTAEFSRKGKSASLSFDLDP